MTFIGVRHNIEVAHRLFDMKGKCEAIHGHSMWVDLQIKGQIDSNGILDGLEFGEVKKLFRAHLDGTYDHKLLLNERDPWTQKLVYAADLDEPIEGIADDDFRYKVEAAEPRTLPGLQVVKGDPTTENIAKWIAEWATTTFHRSVDVVIHETHVNYAGYSMKPSDRYV